MNMYVFTVVLLSILLLLSTAMATYYYKLFKKYLPDRMELRRLELLVDEILDFTDNCADINRSFDDILDKISKKSHTYEVLDIYEVGHTDYLSSMDFRDVETTLTKIQFKSVSLHVNNRFIYGWARNGFEIYSARDLGRERRTW